MLLAFILLIFFLMHIEFLARNVFFGSYEGRFFNFTIKYLFDRDIALLSLYFAVFCALAFALGYVLAYRFGRRSSSAYEHPQKRSQYAMPLWPLVVNGLLQIFVTLKIAVSSEFSYFLIARNLESAGFLTELRVLFLLLVAHLFLNVPFGEIIRGRRYKIVRYIVIVYIVALIALQARSRIFEIAVVLGFSHLAWNKDKIKLKYFALTGLALVVPNLIVLGRLSSTLDFEIIIDGIFSFEYSVLFNNMLSEAIYSGPITSGPFTFETSLGLVIPSPIRSALGMTIVKSEYYQDLAFASQVTNGGFSLLAELFTNFGWQSVLILCATGALVGFMNARALRVGQVRLLNAAAPLLYAAFVLAFRNDLGVFIKYSIQLFSIALIFDFLIESTTVKRPRNTHT